MNPPSPIRAGIIGLGVGARHCEAYEISGVATPVAICDQDKTKALEVQKRFPNVQIFNSAEELIQEPKIDIVSIASYDDTHAEYTIRAIEAGKHVYVEKPLCLTSKELNDIEYALNIRPEVRLSSNLVLRMNPRFSKVKKDLDSGVYGDIYLIEADYHYGRLEKITEGWRGDLPFYSVVHGGMIHLLDLVMWLTNDVPISVTALGNAISTRNTKFQFADCVVALLEFASGMIVKASANFGCVKPHYHSLNLFGTKATFQNDTPHGRIYRSRSPHDGYEIDSSNYMSPDKSTLLVDFVRSLASQTEPFISQEDTLSTMRLSLGVEKALQTGEKVRLKP